MAARIILPDGTPATIHSRTWSCPDPEALPVLDYFARRIGSRVYEHIEDTVARGVVAILVGARFVDSDPRRPLDPDVVV